MNTKMLFSFIITHPDAEMRFDHFDSLLDYWQAVGQVFSQMLEQMDDQDLAKALERRAIAREGLYHAASDERGLTVLETAESALISLLGEELSADADVEITYA